jgi:protein-arginine kinase activator protein McsA
MEKLENELQTAIETENYEKAARIRDQINKLKG